MKFVVIDLPQANSISVRYWLRRNGQEVVFYSDYIKSGDVDFDAVLVPGVGAFDYALNFLALNKIDKFIANAIKDRKLIVGICLGMQLMFNCSEEGSGLGLALVDASVLKLGPGIHKVPNIGWRSVHKAGDVLGPLTTGDMSYYYFMHGYAVSLQDAKSVIPDTEMLSSDCNGQFLAGFRKANLIGLQFHPEKSYEYGDNLLKRIVQAHDFA